MGITGRKLLGDIQLKTQFDSTHRCYNSSLKRLKTTPFALSTKPWVTSQPWAPWKAFSDKSNWARWVWRRPIASEESTQRPGVMGRVRSNASAAIVSRHGDGIQPPPLSQLRRQSEHICQEGPPCLHRTHRTLSACLKRPRRCCPNVPRDKRDTFSSRTR